MGKKVRVEVVHLDTGGYIATFGSGFRKRRLASESLDSLLSKLNKMIKEMIE